MQKMIPVAIEAAAKTENIAKMDRMTPAQRSSTMSRIRSEDTGPERRIRRLLHARGLRYRLHRRDLPGRPDLYFAKHKTALLVHGCFWHAHGCALSRAPGTRADYWSPKLARNRDRDRSTVTALEARGIRVITVWECAMRGGGRQTDVELGDQLAALICSRSREQAEIAGRPHAASASSRADARRGSASAV